MKKIMLASALAAAAIFTACESSDDLTSCDVSLNLGALGSMHQCAESTDDAYIRSTCKDMNDEVALLGLSDVGKVGSGCAGGAKKTCTDTEDGITVTVYFYDASDANKSCDELLSDDDEEDDYGFTPDDPEYYTKLLNVSAKKK